MRVKTTSIVEQLNNLSEWEVWILNNASDGSLEFTPYDHLCELVVSAYELHKDGRLQEFKDELHYFLLWWQENVSLMRKYRSKSAIGALVNKGHATIIHYVGTGKNPGKRKPSGNFEVNTQCIKDFLRS